MDSSHRDTQRRILADQDELRERQQCLRLRNLIKHGKFRGFVDNDWRQTDLADPNRHCRVNTIEACCDCVRRMKQDGWAQSQIANALNIGQPTVSQRIRLSEASHLHETLLDGNLDEPHCIEILAIYWSTNNFDDWLTSEQA